MTEGNGQLRALVERIERREADKAECAADIKEIFGEAHAAGFDRKILRRVVNLRKQPRAERLEQEALIETYLSALGDI